jgi:DNA-binding PadR family transcriptional regulator
MRRHDGGPSAGSPEADPAVRPTPPLSRAGRIAAMGLGLVSELPCFRAAGKVYSPCGLIHIDQSEGAIVKDAVDRLTPLGVMVLALLREGDMHPYEMMRLMRYRRDDRLVTITNGTMYHTVGRLERAGLLAEIGVDRDGNRPERTTYTVTSDGAAAVAEWVRRELPRVDHPAEFRIALAEAHNLDRDEVVELLGVRRVALVEQRDVHVAGRDDALAKGVPGQYMVEVERQSLLLETDLDWLDGLIARLSDSGFPWGIHEPSDRYLEQRKAARL